jgi:hypothetical protein
MYKLFPHQRKAADQLSNGKILYGGVGSGKGLTALTYYKENEAPKHIYVITTAKKRDKLEWEAEAAMLGIGRDVSVPGNGKLVVDSWNNIGKYRDVEDCFFIFDEQRLVGYGAWVKAFLAIAKKNRWILLSATPGDTWMDYVPVFIANGLYKNITQFKREHVVYASFVRYPKILRYLNEDLLEKYRNMLLVEMPYMKDTVRHSETIVVDFDRDLMDRVLKDRWNVYEDEPIKDVAELFRVMRRVVGEHPSRRDAIVQLLEKHPKLVIFYNFNYELEILRSLASVTTVAEWNGHRKQSIPETDSWVYLVQYVAGAEGWNCVETNAMVFYSLTYSYKNFEQAQGRIDRLNSPVKDLHYYILRSNSQIENDINKNLKRKELFNEVKWASDHGYYFD